MKCAACSATMAHKEMGDWGTSICKSVTFFTAGGKGLGDGKCYLLFVICYLLFVIRYRL